MSCYWKKQSGECQGVRGMSGSCRRGKEVVGAEEGAGVAGGDGPGSRRLGRELVGWEEGSSEAIAREVTRRWYIDGDQRPMKVRPG